MTIDILRIMPVSCALLALGEPTHGVEAFLDVRNEIFAELIGGGFRSIALESDRIAAMRVDDYIRGADDPLDDVMSRGFSHGFGGMEGNRRLVTWLRGQNERRPTEDQIAFYGIDAQMENTSAPSPRAYLEPVREYLEADVDLGTLAGDDERWSRDEAILDASQSPGASPEAAELLVVASSLKERLLERAPELIAGTGLREWQAMSARCDAALGLLGYHRRAAQPGERSERMTRLLAARDGLMAQNLGEIHRLERHRGPMLVFAHNLHLTRSVSVMRMPGVDSTWYGAGAIVAAQVGAEYFFVAGSLGRSAALGIADPGPDSFERHLHREDGAITLTESTTIPASDQREDIPEMTPYFPLDAALTAGSDAVLHLSDTDAIHQPKTGSPA